MTAWDVGRQRGALPSERWGSASLTGWSSLSQQFRPSTMPAASDAGPGGADCGHRTDEFVATFLAGSLTCRVRGNGCSGCLAARLMPLSLLPPLLLAVLAIASAALLLPLLLGAAAARCRCCKLRGQCLLTCSMHAYPAAAGWPEGLPAAASSGNITKMQHRFEHAALGP